jgi:SEC-C motif-containing protein
MSCCCGLPAPYEACCGRFHAGAAAPTAELLMRSRYSAYVVADRDHLLRTWHPTTRPPALELDGIGWTRLEVLGTTGGGLLETEGTVRFRAHHVGGVLEEHSRFVRHAGRWCYLGVVPDRA